MVDCGKTNVLEDLKDALNGQRLNGIVVTHVDNDHIVGVINHMLGNRKQCCHFLLISLKRILA